MINITGNLPKAIVDKLYNLHIMTDGIKTGGSDIDVTVSKNGTDTHLYAIFIGNGKWEIDEIEDNANLFPQIDKADVITVDFITKLFTNAVTSSLILSFNPLGRVKYGIKDKIDKVKDAAAKVKNWMTDDLSPDDAQAFIRQKGTVPYKQIDKRDGKMRKRNFASGDVNVGKMEKMEGYKDGGHYKVLTGSPKSGDFQVWELYRNGNQTRVLDLKAGLQPQEALYVYDNNIPDTWTEADWNTNPEEKQAAKDINLEEAEPTKQETVDNTQTVEQNETPVADEASDNTQTVEQEEKFNVEDELASEESPTEETNLEEELEDFTQFYDGQYDEEVLLEEADNVTEEPKKKKKRVAASLIQSESNVTEEPKKKKKSKYNGCNVTGCVGENGAVSLASGLLIVENLKDFVNYTEKLTGVSENVLKQWNEIKKLLLDISILDKDVLKAMTEESGDNLVINFNPTHTGQNYAVTVELKPNALNVYNKVAGEGNEYNHLLESLKVVKKSLEPKI